VGDDLLILFFWGGEGILQCGEVGTGAGQAPVGRRQLRQSQCRERKPHSTGVVGGSGSGPSHRASVYRKEVEEQNPVEEPVHEQDQVSTTGDDSTYATKGATPARLGYYDNYLVDNDSCVIVGVQATAAGRSQETVAAQDMLNRSRLGKDERQHRPSSTCPMPQPTNHIGSACHRVTEVRRKIRRARSNRKALTDAL